MVLPSSPSNGTRLCDFSFSLDSWCCRNDGLRFLTQQAAWLCSANHGSIRDFSPIAFSGCPREHRVYRETWCPKHAQPNGVMDTYPRTRASAEPTAIAERNLGMDFPQNAQAACC